MSEPQQSIEHSTKQREQQWMLVPLGDKILIRVEEEPDRTPGGIWLPDGTKKEKLEGVVVGVGPGRHLQNGDLITSEVIIGERVIFGRYSGDPVDRDGKKYRILKESEILAVYRVRRANNKV